MAKLNPCAMCALRPICSISNNGHKPIYCHRLTLLPTRKAQWDLYIHEDFFELTLKAKLKLS
jgi:hypothetical protein